jgi:hypothetical protein
MQCKGRITLERGNVAKYKFSDSDGKESRFGFFLPSRCPSVGAELCKACDERRKKIPERLQKWKGSMQNQSDQCHGLIAEPLPDWSRIYGGAYYKKMTGKGLTVSKEAMEKVEEALANAYKGMEGNTDMAPRKKVDATAVATVTTIVGPVLATVPLEPVEPVEPIKKKPGRKSKALPKTPTVIEALNTVEEVKPVLAPVSIPVPLPTKKNQPKKVTKPITGLVNPVALKAEDFTVVKIPLKKIEIDGRNVYLQSDKDKVFDLKFNYLGHYDRREDAIVTGYADTDAEI